MLLFPIAFLWLALVVLWALRQTLEPSDGPWRPWRQRRPTRRVGPHGRPARGGPHTPAAAPSRPARAAGRR